MLAMMAPALSKSSAAMVAFIVGSHQDRYVADPTWLRHSRLERSTRRDGPQSSSSRRRRSSVLMAQISFRIARALLKLSTIARTSSPLAFGT